MANVQVPQDTEALEKWLESIDRLEAHVGALKYAIKALKKGGRAANEAFEAAVACRLTLKAGMSEEGYRFGAMTKNFEQSELPLETQKPGGPKALPPRSTAADA